MRRIEGNPPIIKLDARDYEDIWVPAEATQKLIGDMPCGKWELPESYKSTDLINSWIRFLDIVAEGKKLDDVMGGNNCVVGDPLTLNTYRRFYSAMKDEIEDKDVFDNGVIPSTINSCRKSFLFLLSEKQTEKLGHKKPHRISKKDVSNAKLLVERLLPEHFDLY